MASPNERPNLADNGVPATSGPRIGRLALKELRETLRDRRTIITLALMPVFVYPLLGIAFQKFFLAQAALQQPAEFHLAFTNAEEASVFKGLFSQGNQRLGRELSPSQPLPPKLGERPDPQLKFLIADGTAPKGQTALTLEMAVTERFADVGVRVGTNTLGGRELTLLKRAGSELGAQAIAYIEKRLHAVNQEFVTAYLGRQQPPVCLPIAWSETLLPGEATAGFSLATIVPLVLILMTVTGAVYPAIDLTAGERERGTLEALIAAPVPRERVLVAKYIAVLTVALLTAVANLTAMLLTAYGTGLEGMLFGTAGLSLSVMGQIFGLLAIFAAFFSAVILMLTSIARSFKEAQAYLIPLMLLSLAPGVIGLLPGLKLTTSLALVPLINIVLLTRDVLDGRGDAGAAAIVLASTGIAAGLALLGAARIFGTDAVLYGSSGQWRDLWQRPSAISTGPSLDHGVLALGVILPAFVLLGSVPSRLTTWPLAHRLLVSAAITILLFAVWPLALSLHRRLTLSSTFGLEGPTWRNVIGAACWGLALWPWAYELKAWTLSREQLETFVRLASPFKAELDAIPLVIKLGCLAVVPAVCEELFFRGFLLRSLRSALGPWSTIAVTAAIFGALHVLVRDALLLERFAPTAALGLVLGWLALRTGSVLPGMVLHTLHNSTVLLLGTVLNERFLGTAAEAGASTTASHLPLTWLAVSLAVLTVGTACCWPGGSRKTSATTP